MQGNRIYMVLCLALFMGLTLVSAEWKDVFGPPHDVTLAEILENPTAWLDIPVRMQVRFSRFGKIYNPFFTRFSEDSHLNFAAWAIQTHIWTKEGFGNQHPFFYVRKDNAELKGFLRLNTFDTISIYAKVMSIFDNKPSFEVVWMCHLPGDLNIYNLRLLNRATDAFNTRKFPQAEAGFMEILTTDPPHDIRVMIHKTIAKIHMYEHKDCEAAMIELEKAIAITPQDGELKSLYKICQHYLVHGGTPPVPQDMGPDQKAVVPSKLEGKEAATLKPKEPVAPKAEEESDAVEDEDSEDNSN